MAIFRGTGGAGDSTDDSIVSEVTEQAGIATTKAQEAATSATNASNSASSASSSETAASNSATAAAGSASTATTKASEAASHASDALASKNAAATSATAAADSATAANSANVQTVAGLSTEITNLNGIRTDITGVNAVRADVVTVSGISSDVTTVAADASDIGTVATNITNVNNVGDNISNVNAVHSNASNINTVAADGSDIGTVAGNISNVNTVAGISSDVTTVAGLESKMDAVIADASDIGAVAGNIGNVNTVAGDSSDINTVAGISADVTSVADNMTDVQNADTNAANAATSASNASDSASAASTSAGSASSSASSASTSATSAGNSATTASNSATAASASKDAAASSASAASGSASAAASSASAASTSASNAATSETNSEGSENASALSATAAATSASNAATSESNAATSATNAAVSETNAAASYDSFDDRYLGVKSSAPSTDNDGGALLTGALYFNSTSNTMFVFTGSAWAAVANNNIINPNVALTQDLATNGNDVKFGDNDKATFGASDDLQIYHDGFASYVVDDGTGDLYIRGGDDIRIQGADGSGSWQSSITINQAGSVDLHHNGSPKIATTSTGIDVTGTVETDELTVSVGGVAQLGNLVRIGNNSAYADLTLNSADNSFGTINFADASDSNVGRIQYNHVDNTMILRAADATRVLVSSTGIDVTGTATMDGLTVQDIGNTSAKFERSSTQFIEISGSAGGQAILSNANDAVNKSLIVGTVDSNAFALRTDDKNRVLIDSNGDISFYEDTGTTPKLFWDASAESLGIGTSSPSSKLHVSKSSVSGTSYDSNDLLTLENNGFTAINMISSASTASTLIFSDTTRAVGYLQYNHSDNSLRTNVNGSERLRIDSSGNLLVGTTSTTPQDGDHGFVARANGYTIVSVDDARPMLINRATSDGELLNFRKDGTTVGSIGVLNGNNLSISGSVSNHTGIQFGTAVIAPMKSGAENDGDVDLGFSNARFKDLYLSGGVYLGGTGSANKLDDYEEGTFTPSLTFEGQNTGMVLGSVHGTYTKVGRMVTCNIRGTISTLGSSTGQLYLEGLPFTVGDTLPSTGLEAVGHVGFVSKVQVTTTNLNLIPTQGGTVARFPYTSSSYETEYLGSSSISNNFDFRATLTYFTA